MADLVDNYISLKRRGKELKIKKVGFSVSVKSRGCGVVLVAGHGLAVAAAGEQRTKQATANPGCAHSVLRLCAGRAAGSCACTRRHGSALLMSPCHAPPRPVSARQVTVLGVRMGDWGKEKYGMKPKKVEALEFYR